MTVHVWDFWHGQGRAELDVGWGHMGNVGPISKCSLTIFVVIAKYILFMCGGYIHMISSRCPWKSGGACQLAPLSPPPPQFPFSSWCFYDPHSQARRKFVRLLSPHLWQRCATTGNVGKETSMACPSSSCSALLCEVWEVLLWLKQSWNGAKRSSPLPHALGRAAEIWLAQSIPLQLCPVAWLLDGSFLHVLYA